MFNISIDCIGSSSAGNCFIISGYKTKIFIECGITIKKIAEHIGYKFSDFSACLVSHSHLDHCKSAFEMASRGVNVIAHKSVFDKFKEHHRFQNIPKKTFEVGEFKITPFKVEHDVKNYGFMIDSKISGERIIFIIDTYFSPFTFENVTHFIVEANHSEKILEVNLEKSNNARHLQRLWKSHMSIERTCDLLLANDLSKVKEIHLSHLSKGNGNGAEFKDIVEKLTEKRVLICKQ